MSNMNNMNIAMTSGPDGATWRQMPEDAGQIVSIEYAVDEDGMVWRRTTDRSDGDVIYHRLGAVVAYEPQNGDVRWE